MLEDCPLAIQGRQERGQRRGGGPPKEITGEYSVIRFLPLIWRLLSWGMLVLSLQPEARVGPNIEGEWDIY